MFSRASSWTMVDARVTCDDQILVINIWKPTLKIQRKPKLRQAFVNCFIILWDYLLIFLLSLQIELTEQNRIQKIPWCYFLSSAFHKSFINSIPWETIFIVLQSLNYSISKLSTWIQRRSHSVRYSLSPTLYDLYI